MRMKSNTDCSCELNFPSNFEACQVKTNIQQVREKLLTYNTTMSDSIHYGKREVAGFD